MKARTKADVLARSRMFTSSRIRNGVQGGGACRYYTGKTLPFCWTSIPLQCQVLLKPMDWHNISDFLPKADHAFDAKTVDLISKNRKELNGTLFFDKIWHSIGLTQPTKYYPPKSSQDLNGLWQKVVKLERPEESKQAVLFYVLRDLRHGKNNPDTKFASAVYLPRKYQIFMSGLWELDHLHFQPALEHLTNPLVDSEFVDDVFDVLTTHPKSDKAWALAYYQSKSPSLQNENLLEAYYNLLLDSNIAEAFDFCRARSAQRRILFEALIRASLTESDGEVRRSRLNMLMSLPLTSDEDRWLEDYLLTGEGSKLSNARDVLMMRGVAQGPYPSDIEELVHYHGSTIEGVTWDEIRSGLQRATKQTI